VNLHTDIPSRGQIDRLLTNRDPASVSIYVPTDPASSARNDCNLLTKVLLHSHSLVRSLEEAGC